MRPMSGHMFSTRFSRAVLGMSAAALMLAFSVPGNAETAKTPASPETAKANAPAAPAAHAPAPSGPQLAGFWQAYNDDGKPGGVFYFYENHGLFEGRLVKSISYPDDPPSSPLCVQCPGDKKNTPMMGLVIVMGMKRIGPTKYEDGHILDPRDGSIYNAELDVTPDNKKLNLRGYLGISLLGQTRVWTRLPDDTMAPADIPGEPIAALGGAQAKKPAHPAAPSGGAAPVTPKPAPAAPAPAAPAGKAQ